MEKENTKKSNRIKKDNIRLSCKNNQPIQLTNKFCLITKFQISQDSALDWKCRVNDGDVADIPRAIVERVSDPQISSITNNNITNTTPSVSEEIHHTYLHIKTLKPL